MVSVVIFLAVFTQTITGFGSALVSMAVLPQVLGIRTAAPLVALMAGVLELVLLARYRRALKLQAVWRMAAASLAGIPLGILALRHVDEKVILSVLGIALSAYALYALLGPRLPELRHPAWAYASGFLAGLLGGAYNTSGPPVIVYGTSRGWNPNEFRSNLQAFFLLNSALVIASHAWSQNFTPIVWQQFGIALPAIGLGLIAGFSLERRIAPERFRRIVLWLLLIMGLRLLIG